MRGFSLVLTHRTNPMDLTPCRTCAHGAVQHYHGTRHCHECPCPKYQRPFTKPKPTMPTQPEAENYTEILSTSVKLLFAVASEYETDPTEDDDELTPVLTRIVLGYGTHQDADALFRMMVVDFEDVDENVIADAIRAYRACQAINTYVKHYGVLTYFAVLDKAGITLPDAQPDPTDADILHAMTEAQHTGRVIELTPPPRDDADER